MKKTYRILELDPCLLPYERDIRLRMERYAETRLRLLGDGKSLSDYANGHLYFGFHQLADGWVYREWAPNARAVTLFGDFNGWNRDEHWLTSLPGGVWEVKLPGRLPHGSKVRIRINTDFEVFERVPLYVRRAVQDPATHAFDGQIWAPETPYRWRDADFRRDGDEPLMIYECHIGMSGEAPGIATYAAFAETVLPYAKSLGYNAIQLMAVMEHPYYGSFGYQVSSFFAASSRFGTPEELKALVDAAHALGMTVLLDLVHAHAAKNEVEGIGRFDGTDYQFFHSGPRGTHPQWDSKLFNYGKPEVLHFLLSNLKFWLDEYHFDGFRFDGVTSMLYRDHGLGGVFDHYRKYFSLSTDTDAVTYLQLATGLCREVRPDCVLVAEDMSGMPGMAVPVADGGIGFDYRLGMGMPDFWVRTLKTQRDDDWDIGRLWYELGQRRPQEKVVGYCESHDQALVGDKTIMFWLADKEMYWHMDCASQNPAIDRAIALHKMIRLITCVCAGEGYLNFMGNEFGHPEWIDFPRPGNGDSYHYARRQWSLSRDPNLRYRYLLAFDRAMVGFVKRHRLSLLTPHLVQHHEAGKALVFEKGRFLFLFNFHPTNDFVADVGPRRSLTPVLHTSWPEFGGYRPQEVDYVTRRDGRACISVDRRSAIVYEIK